MIQIYFSEPFKLWVQIFPSNYLNSLIRPLLRGTVHFSRFKLAHNFTPLCYKRGKNLEELGKRELMIIYCRKQTLLIMI